MLEETSEGTSARSDSTTDTASDVVNDEDRLRQEAAKRLERRRRKMMSPEERLAKITGRPVSSSSPVGEEAPSSLTGVASSSSSDQISTCTSTVQAEDPPLETLTRDPTRGSFSNILPQGAGSEGDLLSSLLGGGGLPGELGGGQGGAGAAQPPPPATGGVDIIWVMLALVVRLVLDTEYASLIGHNCVLPYILTLGLMYNLGYVSSSASTVSSLLSAALMLCGVQAKVVGYLTKTLSIVQLVVHTFSLYLFTFFISHVVIVAVIDKVI